jgi:hypothetical protein
MNSPHPPTDQKVGVRIPPGAPAFSLVKAVRVRLFHLTRPGSLRREWREPIARDNVREPVGFAELKSIRLGESGYLSEVRRAPAGHDLGQFVEEVFEARRADDLDHPRWDVTSIPHRVHLTARFGDVPARAEDGFAVARSEAYFAFGDYGVLIFSGVEVRPHKCAHWKRVLDYRDCAVRVAAP